jgi:hypothetical protein
VPQVAERGYLIVTGANLCHLCIQRDLRGWNRNDACRGAPVSQQNFAGLQLTRARVAECAAVRPGPGLTAVVSQLSIHDAWTCGRTRGDI